MRYGPVLAAILGVMVAAARPQERREDTLRLKDYQPKSMLKVAAHPVARARYPVVNLHAHLRNADPAKTIAAMDAMNVRTLVNLDGGWGDHLKEQIRRFKPYPGRVIHFARVDWKTIDDPDFSEKAARQLEEGHKLGARGLKISKALGLYVRNKAGKLIAVNDPRLDSVWAKCGELGMPVAIHVADPDAFFQPIDRHNERYEQLKRRPEWGFTGKDYPSKETLLEQRNDIVARHPKTIFIGLHVANRPENLAEVAGWLDRYPNLHVEFGARLNEIGRQPYTSRKFFLKYQDRILYGTDGRQPDPAQYRRYFRYLETFDEYFGYAGSNRSGRWMIYGIGLPDEVLEKVYTRNAAKLLKLDE